MAWEKVKCSKCGGKYSVQMYGPHKTSEWKINSWRGICDDCKEAAKAALVEQNKSGDLPVLTGSKNQIAWAMKIRQDTINELKNIDEDDLKIIIEDCEDDHGIIADQVLIDTAISHIAKNTSAHWWIDVARNSIDIELITATIVEIHKTIPANTADDLEKKLQADAEAEAVIAPPEPISETIANFHQTEKKIAISFREKNEDFKKIIKAHGYRWDNPWTKHLSFNTDSPDDRVAEIGHALLAAGFKIRIMNHDIREKIIASDFQPEHTRWISVLTKKPDMFYIQWVYGDDMYSEAIKIAGARYDKPGITVPMDNIDDVLDFADIYKFKFSPAALKLIELANINKTAALVIEVAKKETPVLPNAQDGIPILDVPKNVEVADEFKN